MSADMWVVAVLAVFLGYPTVAGIVYRHVLAARRCVVPEAPNDTNHKRRRGRYDILDCNGWEDAARRSYLGREFYCPGCWARGRAIHHNAEAERTALVAAWLWPVAGIAEIPRRLFYAGANVTTTPTPDSLPDPSDAPAGVDP